MIINKELYDLVVVDIPTAKLVVQIMNQEESEWVKDTLIEAMYHPEKKYVAFVFEYKSSNTAFDEGIYVTEEWKAHEKGNYLWARDSDEGVQYECTPFKYSEEGTFFLNLFEIYEDEGIKTLLWNLKGFQDITLDKILA